MRTEFESTFGFLLFTKIFPKSLSQNTQILTYKHTPCFENNKKMNYKKSSVHITSNLEGDK